MDAIVEKLCPKAVYGGGATFGRRAWGATLSQAEGPFYIRKLKLTDGYDPGGAYWGVRPEGVFLYGYLSVDGNVMGYVDAADPKAALAELRKRHPRAKRA